MIGTLTNFNYPGQRFQNFGTLYSTNNDTETLRPVISDLDVWKILFLNAVE